MHRIGSGSISLSEKLLLQSAILPLPRAHAAWEEFCRVNPDPEKLDHEAFQYFPAIADKLKDWTDRTPHYSRLRSVQRHSWAQRHQFLLRLQPLLQRFEKGQMEMILLGSLGLSFLYQPYRGECAQLDRRFLVPGEARERARLILAAEGWTPLPETSGQAVEVFSCGKESLTLQSELFPGAGLPSAQASIWRKAREIAAQGSRIKILHRDHSFLLVCAQGAEQPARVYPWLTDAAHLLSLGVPLRRLEVLAHRYGVLAEVRATLLALHDSGLALPPDFMKAWRDMRFENPGQPDVRDEARFSSLEGRLRLVEARINRVEGSPPLQRHHSREKTRLLVMNFLRENEGAGLFTLYSRSFSFMRSEHHFRAYNRRARFLGLMTRGYFRRRSSR
jgi:hypothetical protein